MARVRFLEDYDYKPVPAVTIAYEAGMIATVKRDCAEKAVADGKAEFIPASSDRDGDGDGDEAALGG